MYPVYRAGIWTLVEDQRGQLLSASSMYGAGLALEPLVGGHLDQAECSKYGRSPRTTEGMTSPGEA